MEELIKVVDVETIEEVVTFSKYPKTDYTYSPMSRDRVELAPGQVAVPNMSRRSLSQFRVQGPNTVDEPDKLTSSWSTTTTRKRFTAVESSDDESPYIRNGSYSIKEERWWLMQLLATVLTTITTSTRNAYRKIVGPSHRYPYTERNPAKAGVLSQTAKAVAAPFYWIYTVITSVITTTVTTVTETISPNKSTQSKYRAASYQEKAVEKRKLWPFLLLLLPAFGYGFYYTYENMDHLAVPNFTDLYVDLSEFTSKAVQSINVPSLPSITLPVPNLTLPEINIKLPTVMVTKQYTVYKEVLQNRMVDASDYVQVVAESCWEEIRRYWSGVFG